MLVSTLMHTERGGDRVDRDRERQRQKDTHTEGERHTEKERQTDIGTENRDHGKGCRRNRKWLFSLLWG